ncbi:hypothetical protein [Aeoliella sp.]|uniref:hypothetical protein n=1 Tax=Aeoliella sp. TaxID=2795800 RepID=UPI003CCBED49
MATTTIPDCRDVHALIPWLRRRWIEVSGKRGTPIVSPERFLLKLRSGCHIDRPTFLAMRRTLQAYYATEFGEGIDLHPIVGSEKGGALCNVG